MHYFSSPGREFHTNYARVLIGTQLNKGLLVNELKNCAYGVPFFNVNSRPNFLWDKILHINKSKLQNTETTHTVEAPMCLKVSNCMCLKVSNCSLGEKSFTDQKYMCKEKLESTTKLIFLKFSCKKWNIFCNFKVNNHRYLFMSFKCFYCVSTNSSYLNRFLLCSK
jgi:hypothetical protein